MQDQDLEPLVGKQVLASAKVPDGVAAHLVTGIFNLREDGVYTVTYDTGSQVSTEIVDTDYAVTQIGAD